MKFTFKTERPTGAYRSFYSPSHCIKLKKSEVGTIDDKDTHEIRLRVIKADINENGNPNCEWKWICLKKESASLQEAKDWLNENIDVIMKKHNLYLGE